MHTINDRRPEIQQRRCSRRLRKVTGIAAVIALASAISCSFGALAQQGQSPNPDKPLLVPEANRPPDKNDQIRMNEKQARAQDFETANAERKRQIAEDAAHLLQLATELKAEIDKTGKNTLSLNVIRKAETIERLAKGVKEKMKLTIGGS